MQISIQKLIDNEATREEIADAMLLNYEDHENILSDEDEPLEVFDTIDESFLIADVCQEYDLYKSWNNRSTILKINDSYFSWNYGMNARYGDWDFYGCEKVIPHKKIVLDVEFLPVGDTPTKQETTALYAKVYMGL